MAYSRRIRPVGADGDELTFVTPSWSRPKSDIEHTLTINKRDGWVRCTCEDATYRKKRTYLLDWEAPTGCKHIKSLLSHYRTQIIGDLDVEGTLAP